MKHLPIFGSLAMVLVGLLAAHPGPAFGSTLVLKDLGPDFLILSSQGYLGVNLNEVDTDRIRALRLKDGHGAEVTRVDHDAPAAKSGLKVHDVILQLDGQGFDNVDQLRQRLRELPPGRKVNLLISRDGNPIYVTVQLCDQAVLGPQAWSQHITVPAPNPPASSYMGSGFVEHIRSTRRDILDTVMPKTLYTGAIVNPVMPQLADYFGVRSGTGLLVENVDLQSPAGKAGLKAGDVVVRVESNQMKSRNDWLKAIRSHRGQPVLVTVMRNKQEQTMTMSAGKPKNK